MILSKSFLIFTPTCHRCQFDEMRSLQSFSTIVCYVYLGRAIRGLLWDSGY